MWIAFVCVTIDPWYLHIVCFLCICFLVCMLFQHMFAPCCTCSWIFFPTKCKVMCLLPPLASKLKTKFATNWMPYLHAGFSLSILGVVICAPLAYQKERMSAQSLFVTASFLDCGSLRLCVGTFTSLFSRTFHYLILPVLSTCMYMSSFNTLTVISLLRRLWTT